MLGRDGKAGLRGAAVLVARLEHIGLLYDLACITQKLGAVVGECNTAARARKDFDMKFLL
ncbi:unknown [Collinsella sp. CAG:166]|nr:unknown [Collinsella sp. CAG:166]